ncbi:Mannosyl phosphorylinositol ceramide synthase SUR1 [Lasiodiplodia theobromae]|uniref:Mannosyl phosphorylinositol ceramide synthase SUR1 n=1 Tax=Lasiodiplodia theobromae TaxID=45133 RepID=UPI0015C3AEA9|nr:Mannosyl phosphorylinositol ceramide synthase SUR1 [Lasiodiplodia theobromae]KAF4539463.1 Mannosyl phosphorylinositol ceramide synthase SUR1 [Lasiodiplodia theobromae]
MGSFRCFDGKRIRPRVLGCVLASALLSWGVLHSLRKPLALLLRPTSDFDTVYISNAKIPKIIHQTYANRTIPDHWKQAQQSCLDLHPDYEYKFWTDEDANEFIAKEYPWFKPTWDSYPHVIQRADAIRYFALVHFGGIYIDLDDGCNYRLDPLLQYPAWLPLTAPIGVSNDVMGSVPHHPFFERVIRALADYNHNWASPYLTVMYTTGPLFLSEMREEYLAKKDDVPPAEQLFTLMPRDYDRNGQSMFRSYRGSSWHEDDAAVIFWLGDHVVALAMVGALSAIAVLALASLKCYQRRRAGDVHKDYYYPLVDRAQV